LGASAVGVERRLQQRASRRWIGRLEEPPQMRAQHLTHALGRRFGHIAGQMGLAALPAAALELVLHGRHEAGVGS
jgi:hypothetical protein